jgi:hypothetical protein
MGLSTRYSMTWSACPGNDGGIARLGAFAGLRLMTKVGLRRLFKREISGLDTRQGDRLGLSRAARSTGPK